MSKAIPKQCWKNALDSLQNHPQAEYIEGWAVTKSPHLTIEHGWLELGGEVIDPTIPGEVEKYFPALRFNASEAYSLLRKFGEVPFVWRLVREENKVHSEYLKARDAALALCAMLYTL